MNKNKTELLTQVDVNNQVIGSISREKAHQSHGIYYRTIFILVYNSDGKILVQKRSDTKDLFPGCWDLSVGGHVTYPDSYEETAVKELSEELGLNVTEADLIRKAEVLVKFSGNGEFFRVFEYHLKPNEIVHPSKDEIAEIKWMTLNEIKKSMSQGSLKWYDRPLQTVKAIY